MPNTFVCNSNEAMVVMSHWHHFYGGWPAQLLGTEALKVPLLSYEFSLAMGPLINSTGLLS